MDSVVQRAQMQLTTEATHVQESQGVMNRVQMQLTMKATHQLESEDRRP